jgi:hypothetical protein
MREKRTFAVLVLGRRSPRVITERVEGFEREIRVFVNVNTSYDT